MRPSLVLLAGIAGLSAMPLAATAATVDVPFINITLGTQSFGLLLPAAGNDGRFRGSASVVLCDGSVREAAECSSEETLDARVSVSVEGSIFPFVEGTVSFFDAGAPTSLGVTFGALVPVIPSLADTVLSGSFTVPQTRTVPAPTITGLEGLPFIGGGVTGDTLQTIVYVDDNSITLSNDGPVTKTWDPKTGVFDCAAVGGCESIFLTMGFNGLGGDSTYMIGGRFDIDAVTPIPLPASAALLGVGLGALGLAARRRREGRAQA